MEKQRSISELADRKAELLEELSEVNAEIASRAGEVDTPAETPAKSRAKSAKPGGVVTATDRAAEKADNTAAKA